LSESTLSLSFNDLQAEVGSFLGWGSGPNPPYNDGAWTPFQQQRILSAVKSGLRNFFFPTPPQGGPTYDWSFLRPVATLGLSSSAQTVQLPDDFGGFEGQITLLTTKGMLWHPIQLVNEGQVRERYSFSPNVTGRPQVAALQPLKGTTATAGQRWQLFLYPQADQAYTLQFTYYLLCDFLDGGFPFPLGGMAHAETILESCLAVAEQRQDDAQGVHTANFLTRLAASIAADRRNKAQTLGYNRDLSDGPRFGLRRDHLQDRIMYKGVQY